MAESSEIQFGDLHFREPAPIQRPERDPNLVVATYGVAHPDDLPIYVDHRAADAIERHALSDTSVELGGILLGKECRDPDTQQPFVWVTRSIRARHYENTSASFTYTHAAWEEISRERERNFPELDIVGWYHTHPDFGIFLSAHDEFLHRNFFSQPLQVAYVVDPIRNRRGFFRWNDTALAAVGGFHLVGEKHERAALARIANQWDDLPDPSDASGLSPRLEAELIAMMRRPHSQPYSARPSIVPALLLASVLLGALLTATLFWLNGISRELERQSLTLARVEAAREGDAAAAEIAVKQRVVDTLLSDLHLGATTNSLADTLSTRTEALERAQTRISQLETEKTALALLAEQTRQDAASAVASLDDAHRRNAALNEQLQRTAAALEEKTRLLEQAARGNKPANLDWTFWAAVTGWVGFVLTGLALLAKVLQSNLPQHTPTSRGSQSAPVSGRPQHESQATHVIE